MDCVFCGSWFSSGDKSKTCPACDRAMRQLHLQMSADKLYEIIKAERNAPLDRSQWEECDTCNNTPGIMFGVVTMSVGKRFLSIEDHSFQFCPECGKPLTEEAWAELEQRIGGNNNV